MPSYYKVTPTQLYTFRFSKKDPTKVIPVRVNHENVAKYFGVLADPKPGSPWKEKVKGTVSPEHTGPKDLKPFSGELEVSPESPAELIAALAKKGVVSSETGVPLTAQDLVDFVHASGMTAAELEHTPAINKALKKAFGADWPTDLVAAQKKGLAPTTVTAGVYQVEPAVSPDDEDNDDSLDDSDEDSEADLDNPEDADEPDFATLSETLGMDEDILRASWQNQQIIGDTLPDDDRIFLSFVQAVGESVADEEERAEFAEGYGDDFADKALALQAFLEVDALFEDGAGDWGHYDEGHLKGIQEIQDKYGIPTAQVEKLLASWDTADYDTKKASLVASVVATGTADSRLTRLANVPIFDEFGGRLQMARGTRDSTLREILEMASDLGGPEKFLEAYDADPELATALQGFVAEQGMGWRVLVRSAYSAEDRLREGGSAGPEVPQKKWTHIQAPFSDWMTSNNSFTDFMLDRFVIGSEALVKQQVYPRPFLYKALRIEFANWLRDGGVNQDIAQNDLHGGIATEFQRFVDGAGGSPKLVAVPFENALTRILMDTKPSPMNILSLTNSQMFASHPLLLRASQEACLRHHQITNMVEVVDPVTLEGRCIKANNLVGGLTGGFSSLPAVLYEKNPAYRKLWMDRQATSFEFTGVTRHLFKDVSQFMDGAEDATVMGEIQLDQTLRQGFLAVLVADYKLSADYPGLGIRDAYASKYGLTQDRMAALYQAMQGKNRWEACDDLLESYGMLGPKAAVPDPSPVVSVDTGEEFYAASNIQAQVSVDAVYADIPFSLDALEDTMFTDPGSKKKKFVRDYLGRKYMVKYGNLSVLSGSAVSRIQSWVLPNNLYASVMPVRVDSGGKVREAGYPGGDLASLQPFIPGADPIMSDSPSKFVAMLSGFTATQRADVLRELAMDWLVAHKDTKPTNYLLTQEGRFVGVDKEQAFKFMGQDTLTMDDLSKEYNPGGSVHALAMTAYIQGTVDFDFASLASLVERVEALPDSEYKTVVQSYTANIPNSGMVLKEAMRRKQSFRADLEKFINEVRARKGLPGTFAFETKARAVPFLTEVEKVEDLGDGQATLAHKETGKRWRYRKMANTPANAASVFAYKAFSDVARLVRGDYPLVGVVKENDGLSVLREDLASTGTLDGVNPKTLSGPEMDDLVSMQVLDWMMSNSNTTGSHLTRRVGGGVVAVDQTNGFALFESDREELSYTVAKGSKTPYYNRFWAAWVKGDISFDPRTVRGVIDRASAVTKGQLGLLLEKVAEARYPGDQEAQQYFVQSVADRKDALQATFEAFFTNLHRDRFQTDKGFFTFDRGWDAEAETPQGYADMQKSIEQGVQAMGGVYADADVQGVGRVIVVDATPAVRSQMVNKLEGLVAFDPKLQKAVYAVSEALKSPFKDVVLLPSGARSLFASAFGGSRVKDRLKGAQPISRKKSKLIVRRNRRVYPNGHRLKDADTLVDSLAGQTFWCDGDLLHNSTLKVVRSVDAQGNTCYDVTGRFTQPLPVETPSGSKWFETTSRVPDAQDGVYRDTSTAYAHYGGSGFGLNGVQKGNSWVATSGYAGDQGLFKIRVYPTADKSFESGLREELDTLSDGLADKILRNPTKAEQERQKKLALLQAMTPHASPSSQINSRLAALGVSEETISRVVRSDIGSGRMAYVLPGRGRQLIKDPTTSLVWTCKPLSVIQTILRGQRSVNERILDGDVDAGASTDTDRYHGGSATTGVRLFKGGRNTKPNTFGLYGDCAFVYTRDLLDRLDVYGWTGDRFQADPQVQKNSEKIENVIKGALKRPGEECNLHEICFRGSIPVENAVSVVCRTAALRDIVLDGLRAEGVLSVNGVPIEQFVLFDAKVPTFGDLIKSIPEIDE